VKFQVRITSEVINFIQQLSIFLSLSPKLSQTIFFFNSSSSSPEHATSHIHTINKNQRSKQKQDILKWFELYFPNYDQFVSASIVLTCSDTMNKK